MPESERRKDLLIAISGCAIAYFSFWGATKFKIPPWIFKFGVYGKMFTAIMIKFRMVPAWIFKFGVYGGTFTMLIYCLRLKLAAENIDPESKAAYREYLKLGSFYSFILFVIELPMMIASLG